MLNSHRLPLVIIHCIIICIFLLRIPTVAFSNEKPAIISLQAFEGKTYKEMYRDLGAPVDKTDYTIKNAPTKSWNHKELFDKYPKIKKNEDIQIMEVTWDEGEYNLLACFHMADGENRCFVAKKILKGIRF